MNFPNAYDDPELLKLLTDVLDAASIGRRPADDIGGRAMRTAMAFQILTAVGEGECDPERLTLAALDTFQVRRSRA